MENCYAVICSTLSFREIPAESVSLGLGGNGLPASAQVVTRHLDDERVFCIATALEGTQPWLDCPERRPFS